MAINLYRKCRQNKVKELMMEFKFFIYYNGAYGKDVKPNIN
ncbi:hypothetical protein [Campylobacter anatolicus]|nr:hypothetical protein [Campylobacter anatolicus]